MRHPPYFCLMPLVAGFYLLAIPVWNKGVENYSSTGS